MQLAALAAVISYIWRDVSDLLFGSLSAIGRRDFPGHRHWTFLSCAAFWGMVRREVG
jgi:hypothetical protein